MGGTINYEKPAWILPGNYKDPVRKFQGSCQEIARILPGNHKDPARKLPGSCEEIARILPGNYQDPARKLQGSCQEITRILSGNCKDPARKLQRSLRILTQDPDKRSLRILARILVRILQDPYKDFHNSTHKQHLTQIVGLAVLKLVDRIRSECYHISHIQTCTINHITDLIC